VGPEFRLQVFDVLLGLDTGVPQCVELGLVAPHLARKLVGGRHRVLLPASILTGALILQISDIAVRTIRPPLELPAGIFTALIGAPYFFYLLRRSL